MLELSFQPLIADAWQTFFGLVVFILWSVGQWLSARNEAKQEQKPRRPRPQPPQPEDLMPVEGRPRQGQQRGQGQRQGPPNQEEALRSEVEEFLRRAQGKPPRPKPTPQPVARTQPPLRQEPLRQDSSRREPLRPAPVARESQPTLRSEGVAEHASRHLSTAEISEHTSQLGSRELGAEVATADNRLESHLHQKFDHELGSLEHRETAAASTAKTDSKSTAEDDVAQEIAQMLRSPQGMRQLIVANEILRRPEW